MSAWRAGCGRVRSSASTFDASLAIGTVFLTLVIPFALDARSTAGAWALEGAGLVWIGLRQKRLLARAFGYLLLLLAGFSMVYARERHGVPVAIFNAYLFNALMAAAACWAAAFFVQRHAERADLHPSEAMVEPLLIGGGTLWLVSAAALEIGTFVSAPFQLAAWLASIGAIAALCVLLSVRLAMASHRLARGRSCAVHGAGRARRRGVRSRVRRRAAAGGPGRSPSRSMRRSCGSSRRAGPNRCAMRSTPSASSCSARSARCRAAPSPAAGATRPARGRGSAGSSFRRCC